jgi:hypothetical protein
MLPVRPPIEGNPHGAAAFGAHLTYFGGPVLSHVEVVPLFWSADTPFQSELATFYSEITNSTYFDLLTEYDTPTAPSTPIRRGSALRGVVDASPPAGSALSDTDIETELARLIDAALVPQNSPNRLYMIHFPPGVSINLNGDESCVVFCAYHNTFVHAGANVYYGVVPDQGGACAGGCGNAPQQFDNETSVSSHELVESVTDPAVGLATQTAAPLAWYDPVNGEIGDICNAEETTVTGATRAWTVQMQWSNLAGACVAAAAGSSGGAGGGGAGGGGAGGGSGGGGGDGGAGGGQNPPCTESEPNDSADSATPLCDGDPTIFGTIANPRDVDFYTFDVAAGSTFQVVLGNLPADYALSLYRQGRSGATHLVASAADNHDLGDQTITVTAGPGGTYFARVRSVRHASDDANPYAVTVTAGPPAALLAP